MTEADSLNDWLALEHEAVWLLPVVGARFDSLRERATEAFETHRDTRDALLARLAQQQAEPATASLTYPTGPLTTVDEARAAVQSVEARVSAACLELVGVTEGDDRGHAVRNLTRSALAELSWGAVPRAFPGLP